MIIIFFLFSGYGINPAPSPYELMIIYWRDVCRAPISPRANIGTWGYKEGVHRLAVAGELSSGR